MADTSLWQDKKIRAAFEDRGKKLLEDLRSKLENQTGVIAIEPDSGDYFIGTTLGKANDAAYAKYPDKWFYFARLDNPEAVIALPTW
jgi:hypothetical protein